jgi:hypothetical protein
MAIHPTLPAQSQSDFMTAIRNALGHMFPLNAVRIDSAADAIVIEDDDGREWSLIVYRGGTG